MSPVARRRNMRRTSWRFRDSMSIFIQVSPLGYVIGPDEPISGSLRDPPGYSSGTALSLEPCGTVCGTAGFRKGGEMPYELDLATETRGLAAIVRLHGTFDMHGAASFDREIARLLHRDTREILVDL